MDVGVGAAQGLVTYTEALCGRLAVTLGLSSLPSESNLPIVRPNPEMGGPWWVPSDPFSITSCGLVGVRPLFVSVFVSLSVSVGFSASPCLVLCVCDSVSLSLCVFLCLISMKSSVALTL